MGRKNTTNVTCSEKYGRHGTKTDYLIDDGTIATNPSNKTSNHVAVIDFLKNVFLPQGYPDSVSKDYINYQLWDTFQAFLSTLMGTLATQAVLTGIGVGEKNVTPLAATITWLLRDGCGMLGGIVFAWKQGSSLDCDSKRWRLFADFMNNVAIGFDLMATHVGTFNTAVLCLSSIFRSFVGVAGSATRTAFVEHQARRQNLADVAAKDGSQETVVNLLGMIVSLVLLPYASSNTGLTWFLYSVFASLHLFSNYKAVRSVIMDSLNQARLQILINSFMENPKNIPDIQQTNMKEPVIIGEKTNNIYLGCSIHKTTEGFKEFKNLQTLYLGSRYLLNVNMKMKRVFITLHEESDSSTIVESSFQAHTLLYFLQNSSKKEVNHTSLNAHKWQGTETSSWNKFELLEQSRKFTRDKFPTFLKILQANSWKTNHNLLGADEWRASWKFEDF